MSCPEHCSNIETGTNNGGRSEEPNRLPAYTVEIDVLQNLKRIYYFAKRMARAAVPTVILREAS